MQALIDLFLPFPNVHISESHLEKGMLIRHGRQKAVGLKQKIQRLLGKEKKDILAEAAKYKCTKVICGIGKHTEISKIGKISYINCGNWETNETWAEENASGTINIFTFNGEQMVVWGI
jgi:UDP-2,3-diacylglucosamine pyrophosphatase LpxH